MIKNELKSIAKLYTPPHQAEGVGARVQRIIGGGPQGRCDPFLMLDFFSSKLPAGFPDHPHRGFETITYMKQGAFLHEDHLGNKGEIGPGDLQWMTAGRGIVHAEMPKYYDRQCEGYQLWLNLAAKDKFQKPGYQEFKANEIPLIKENGYNVKLIAGEHKGHKGPIKVQTEAYYMDIQIQPNQQFLQEIPKQWNCLLHIYEGQGFFGKEQSQASKGQAIQLKLDDSTTLQVNTTNQPVSFMLMAGKPLNEPIFQHGPFVLASQKDLYQTFEDYQYGKNGFEGAGDFQSKIQNLAKKKGATLEDL